MNPHADTVARAYRQCRNLVKSHYENFPVATLLLPRQLRNPIAAIYSFARTADDIADEGDLSGQARIAALRLFGEKLDGLKLDNDEHEYIFIAVADTVQQFGLPQYLFHDLLSAFTQDVTTKRYANYDELLDYCRRSANPVGRLLLYLTGQASDENLRHSDCICSALQLINFLQDMHQDKLENDRIYMPLHDLARFEVSERHFQDAISDHTMNRLFEFEVERAKALLLQGASLGLRLNGRFGMQLRMMIGGGMMICQHLEKLKNCFDRPRLTRRDWLSLLKYAIMPSSFEKAIKPINGDFYESHYP